MRIGIGWDSHAFQPGVPLRIGGVEIDHPCGLAGHSDGDVLLHAITDALLGAVAAGDIGSFFPPGDPRWKNTDSSVFVETALEEVRKTGYRIANVDTTLILAEPKIAPLASRMRERVSTLLGIDSGSVSIKAKTPEGLRQDDVAVAQAVVLLEVFGGDDSDGMAAAREEAGQRSEAQTQVDDVVRRLVDDSEANPVREAGSPGDEARGGSGRPAPRRSRREDSPENSPRTTPRESGSSH